MRRRRGTARAALVAALFATAPALAADPSAWVGRYTFDKIDGRDFWTTLGPALDRTLGAPLAAKLRKGWGPTSPVVRTGDWTVGWMCKAHNCGPSNVTVAVSSTGRLVACTYGVAPGEGAVWREAAKPPRPAAGDCPDSDAMVAAMRKLGIAP